MTTSATPHSSCAAANIAAGYPLTEEDRWPRIAGWIRAASRSQRSGSWQTREDRGSARHPGRPLGAGHAAGLAVANLEWPAAARDEDGYRRRAIRSSRNPLITPASDPDHHRTT